MKWYANITCKPRGRTFLFLSRKLIITLLMIFTLQLHARSYAQVVTLEVKQASLAAVFKSIWTQTGYDFVYDQALLKTARPVSLQLKQASIESALEACFAGQPFTYTVNNKIVVVKAAAVSASRASQQGIDIRGQIVDEKGTPLPGASIQVKGSSKATTTSSNGNFQLKDVPADAVLVISFIGYKTLELPANADMGIVRLAVNDSKLSEVVVIAYGTQKKQDVTGAIASVSGAQLRSQQVVSVTQGLQGLTPGVTIINGSGQPGSNPTIRIRGVGSINASSSPLLVVDGIPYDGNINTINPNDVESMSVLKDASAAALYGSRAANGVILITTRRGKAGQEPSINFYSSYGVSSRAVKEYAYVSSEDYLKLAWEAQKNYAISQQIANPGQYASDNLITGINTFGLKYNPYNVANPIDANGQLKPGAKLLWNTDWETLARNKVSSRKNVGANISGGNDKYRYYISADYLNQDGIVKNSNYTRVSTRFNGDAYLKKWLKIGLNTTIASSKENNPSQANNPYSNAVQFSRIVSSIYPLYRRNDAGDLVLDAGGNPIYDFGTTAPGNTINHNRPSAAAGNMNAIALLDLDKNTGQGLQTSMNAYGEVIFTDFLKFRSNIGVDRFTTSTLTYANPKLGDAAPVGGRVRRDGSFTTSWTWNNMLFFDKTFGLHHVTAMVSMEAYDFNRKSTAVGSTGFPVPGLEEVGAGASKETATSGTDRNRMQSYLGRGTYSYADKYFLEGTLRRDASTRWAPGKRWGTFYSIGGSWILSNESFMKQQEFFDLVKLRASYGELGNQSLTDYFPYLGVYSTGANDLGYPGVFNSSLGNNNLSWEKLSTYNVGLDLTFLNNRLDLSIEYYYKNTFDLIFTKPLPSSGGAPVPPTGGVTSNTGVAGVISNIGKMKNSGIEVSINSRNLIGAFKWSTSFNLGTVDNKITALPQAAIVSGNSRLEVGRSYSDFWIYEWAGVNPTNGKPQWYANDPSNPGGTVIVNQLAAIPASGSNPGSPAARRSYQGSSLPKVTGGFGNNFSYKSFDLSVLFNYAFGGKVLDNDYIRLMHGFSRLGSSLSTDILDRWQKPGDITDVPKLAFGQNEWETASTRHLFNGDYIRLRNVTLGYTLPAHVVSKTNVIKSFRVFFQADNIYTWTRLKKGTDPEQSIEGTTRNSSSTFKTFSLGLNVGF